MTAICPAGGSSSPKTPALASAIYTAGALAEVLVRFDSPVLIPVIPLLGLTQLSLDTFCATDPPNVPTFTLAETESLLGLKFDSDFFSGLDKARDYVLNMLWYELCKCDSGNPSPFTPTTYPADTPITQYPAPTNGPCDAVFTYSDTFAAGSGSLNRGGPIVTAGVRPTAFVYHCVGTPGTGSVAGGFNWTFEQVGPGNVTLRSDVVFVATPTATVDRTVPAIQNVQTIRLTQASATGNYTQKITGTTITTYCGPPEAIQSPCCPPDTSAQATLDAILALVTLIQRQAVPFAYVDGAVHSGLSGSGEISLHGLLGVRIDITTIPGRIGSVDGDPVTLFDLGWIAWGDATGFRDREFIRRETQLSLPASSGVYTRLGYTLSADVVATITEIVREP